MRHAGGKTTGDSLFKETVTDKDREKARKAAIKWLKKRRATNK